MKKFIGKVEAFNLYLAGQNDVLVFDNYEEVVYDFCDLMMFDYRDNNGLQFMVEVDACGPDEPKNDDKCDSFIPTDGFARLDPSLLIPATGDTLTVTTTTPLVDTIRQRDYAEAQCP